MLAFQSIILLLRHLSLREALMELCGLERFELEISQVQEAVSSRRLVKKRAPPSFLRRRRMSKKVYHKSRGLLCQKSWKGSMLFKPPKTQKMGHGRVKSTTEQNYDNRKQTLLSASVTVSKKDLSDTGIKSGSPSGTILDRAAICAMQSITLTRNIDEEHSLNKGRVELPDLNVPSTVQAASTSPMHTKEESGGKVNGSILESTILVMETMVAKSRQLHGDVQDVDDSEATKCRLPQELEQKLETVARLAVFKTITIMI
ncbi:uncharacterized protein LOC112502669 isoform X1 [Cynara cardunculus var. scolymus]|uniref:uncharacterized protein LOC112502669 isoform X1 n=1 Tax=Cynara cardunculus var. scolymus TaxID=59895 RepID=UPI000D62990D|nr:uncharacterized protein LOC112502669 isoform X1 [Cynara cardunculus var. scolymus]